MAKKLKEINELKSQLADMNETVNSAHEFHGKINQLYDEGLIKENMDGSIAVVEDHLERQHLKEVISSKKRPYAEAMG